MLSNPNDGSPKIGTTNQTLGVLGLASDDVFVLVATWPSRFCSLRSHAFWPHSDISPATDANGNVVMRSAEFTDGAIIFPLPFKCNVRPRSRHVRDIIAEAVNTH
ncbi:hypothetical protein A0H81_08928 [Grifola frondosa]|uniref:Uncharacterized protein n=1 Tax=Grifola frondosa TaxID=5627 RepID=A0A1C7M2K1_GRIFR|nr:hypothetical protein A0H81_08928 [Grifola frondosa]